MVIFHSHVSLPEGNKKKDTRFPQSVQTNPRRELVNRQNGSDLWDRQRYGDMAMDQKPVTQWRLK